MSNFDDIKKRPIGEIDNTISEDSVSHTELDGIHKKIKIDNESEHINNGVHLNEKEEIISKKDDMEVNIENMDPELNPIEVFQTKDDIDTPSSFKQTEETTEEHTQEIYIVPSEDEKEKPTVSPLLHKERMKWCQSCLKALFKHRDAGPFLVPVDPVALGIPDYPTIIKHPMDFSTIDKKLQAKEYNNHEEFIADVQLVFNNCYTYNPPQHPVHEMGKSVEKTFSAQLKRIPQEGFDLAVDTKGEKYSRSANQSPMSSRPRRDTHPPSEFSIIEDQKRKSNRKSEEMKWCMNIVKELFKKQYSHFMFIFYQPVDPVFLNIPTYFDIIKHPMDLSTIKKKLEMGDYSKAEEFEADIRLMFNNCYTFNRPGDDVFLMGQKAEELFNSKWEDRPSFTPRETPLLGSSKLSKKKKGGNGDDSEEFSTDEDEAPIDMQIQMLEQQIGFLQQQLHSLRQKQKRRKEKRKKEKSKSRRSSKGESSMNIDFPKAQAPSQSQPQSRKKKEPEIREITFEEKKELSESINTLSGERLAKVVQIIHESMPNLAGESGQEEIELDIDALDLQTLNKLWNYVKGPKRGRGGGKKSGAPVDPVAAASRITELERELARMDGRVDKTKKLENVELDNDSSSDSSVSDSGSDDSDSD